MTYQVRLTQFEGPLDLLLQLIEKRELDITAISLAAVTDQYVVYLAELEQTGQLDPAALSDFLVIAARLLLIKSQALLPRPAAVQEDEAPDAAEDLARQLQEYRRFKQIAAQLRQRDEEGLHSYARLAPVTLTTPFRLEGVTLDDLLAAMRRVLSALPEEMPAEGVPRQIFSIADKIAAIAQMVSRGPTTFDGLMAGARGRGEVVVLFLALLELIKQGRVAVQQAQVFGEIVVATARPGENGDAPGAATVS